MNKFIVDYQRELNFYSIHEFISRSENYVVVNLAAQRLKKK